jgi:hypothetical protein
VLRQLLVKYDTALKLRLNRRGVRAAQAAQHLERRKPDGAQPTVNLIPEALACSGARLEIFRQPGQEVKFARGDSERLVKARLYPFSLALAQRFQTVYIGFDLFRQTLNPGS